MILPTTPFVTQGKTTSCGNDSSHSSEFYNKLVEVRNQFLYPIDRILYAFDTEVQRWAGYAYKYCGYPCNLMRIGFEREVRQESGDPVRSDSQALGWILFRSALDFNIA